MQISSREASQVRAASQDKNYWIEMVTAWQKSNEHPKYFCERMNIKLATFAHWRGVFKKEIQQNKNKFIELQVTNSIADKLPEFVIEYPAGQKIVFTSEIKIQQIKQILQLLGLIV